MMPEPANRPEDLETEILWQIALTGHAVVATETLSLAIAARCYEEVRVWIENFCRANRLSVEEEAAQREFRFYCDEQSWLLLDSGRCLRA